MYKLLEEINNKEDFQIFLNSLKTDFNLNSEKWENRTIDSYLDAIQSWINDMDGYYINTNKRLPKDINWNFLATLFYVGKIYE